MSPQSLEKCPVFFVKPCNCGEDCRTLLFGIENPRMGHDSEQVVPYAQFPVDHLQSLVDHLRDLVAPLGMVIK